jgi:predicted DNA binding CopG/RHH family protein
VFVLKEDNVKVTLSLSRKSVDFFKHEAKRLDIPYQGMIKSLLDKYTENFG